MSTGQCVGAACSCGCCEGVAVHTPQQIANRPGLTSLSYRVGTHGTFKASMLARLSNRLRSLTTRRDDDFTIGLLDAWATVGDVLTFYQERIADEAYLRTAVEHLSILELARLLGYELSPGVAAEVDLAFTLEAAPGAAPRAVIPAGTRAQSLPGDGETPQPFETAEGLVGHPEWNALAPRIARPQALHGTTHTLHLEGTSLNLTAGEWLLLRPPSAGGVVENHVRRIERIDLDFDAETTRVTLVGGNDQEPEIPEPGLPPAEDDLLLAASEPLEMKARTLATDFTLGTTDVLTFAERNRLSEERLPRWINALPLEGEDDPEVGVFALRAHTAPFGHNAPRWGTLPEDWRLAPRSTAEGFFTQADNFAFKLDPGPGGLSEQGVAAFLPDFDEKVTVGGQNDDLPPYPYTWDPSWPIHKATGGKNGKTYTSLFGVAGNREVLLLERKFTDILPDSWVVLQGSAGEKTFRVVSVDELSRADFGLSAQVTRLTVEAAAGSTLADLREFTLRRTTILAQSEKLSLAKLPVDTPISGSEIELDHMLEYAIHPGQRIAVTGELAAAEAGGVSASEVRVVREVESFRGHSTLLFEGALEHTYRRASVRINANVAHATHGESRRQVLGSGDASQAFQRFELLQSPLTWLSAPVPAGVESTLELRVDGVRWHPAPRFFGLGADERRYVLRRNAEGKTDILFGDGVNGARLPSGAENVTARYRTGIGNAGLVEAGQISILASRPLGVTEVVNPVPATGAEDPENLQQARRNAPASVLTLGRIVSLRDFEDFARTFPGLAKAHASWVWDGEERIVLLTVAGVDGAAVQGTLSTNLTAAMDAARDPFQTVKLASYEALTFDLEAHLQVHPDYQAEVVRRAAEERLRAVFSFDHRDFAQPVPRSAVLTVLQQVEGVEAVDLDTLHISGTAPTLEERLPSLPARFEGGLMVPAQLLTVGAGVSLEVQV